MAGLSSGMRLIIFGCSPISFIALTYLIDSYADVRSELGMDKKGEIQSFLRGVSIQRVFGWMDTQDLV